MSLYLYLIFTQTVTSCGQLPALGQVLLSPSPSMRLWLLYRSVHIVCSLQGVAAALGTHKNLYSTAWYFCVLGCFDPGLYHYCRQTPVTQ